MKKVLRLAIKALSAPDVDVKKTYRLRRRLINAAHLHRFNPFESRQDLVIHTDGQSVPVRIYPPETENSKTIIIFYHGGGWTTGNVDSYDGVCANIAKILGYTVVSVDYRLAPEHPFPAALHDCYAVAQKICTGEADGLQPEQVILMGDSAGGNLAAAVCLMARDIGRFLPSKQILLYPAVYYDHSEQSPFPSVRENGTDYLLTAKNIRDYMQLYISREEDRQSPYFAPLLAKNYSNLPDTLIITAELDPLRDEGEEYGKRLRAAGNQVEIHRIGDALHGFFSLPPRNAQVHECYRIIYQFLQGGWRG